MVVHPGNERRLGKLQYRSGFKSAKLSATGTDSPALPPSPTPPEDGESPTITRPEDWNTLTDTDPGDRTTSTFTELEEWNGPTISNPEEWETPTVTEPTETERPTVAVTEPVLNESVTDEC